MQLRISNIGKIRCATIDLNGITVIAGDNDTGKTTIGKTLFGFFKSCHNLTQRYYPQH